MKCPEFYCMVVKLIVTVNFVRLTHEEHLSYLDAKQKILSTFKDLNI
jgi:hypothetical protein